MEKELDRDWYDNDEGGAFLDESGSYDPFLGGADGDAGTKTADGRLKKKVSARQQAYLADDDKWIDNQLINSGVVTASRAAVAKRPERPPAQVALSPLRAFTRRIPTAA